MKLSYLLCIIPESRQFSVQLETEVQYVQRLEKEFCRQTEIQANFATPCEGDIGDGELCRVKCDKGFRQKNKEASGFLVSLIY